MSPLPEETNADSVAWITANAAAVLEDQQRRAESLQTRAGQVAGFAGAAAALTAPLGAKAFDRLAGCGEVLAALSYFGALAALAATVVLSIVFVLRPVEHQALGATEINNYLTDRRFLVQTPAEIQFRTLKAIHTAVITYERVNKSKAEWLGRAAVCFLIGLLATVALAATVAADKL